MTAGVKKRGEEQRIRGFRDRSWQQESTVQNALVERRAFREGMPMQNIGMPDQGLLVQLHPWLGAFADPAAQHQHQRAEHAVKRHLVHAVQHT